MASTFTQQFEGERSAAERLEALLELEIAGEKETRASLGTLPRLAGEAE